jgi:hypothetical protein
MGLGAVCLEDLPSRRGIVSRACRICFETRQRTGEKKKRKKKTKRQPGLLADLLIVSLYSMRIWLPIYHATEATHTTRAFIKQYSNTTP